MGYAVPSFADMVTLGGRGWGKWCEPADFAPLVSHITLSAGQTSNLYKLTKAGQYTEYLPHVSDLETYVQETGAASSFVVDDGTSAYAIVPYDGKLWWVDPHTHTPKRALFSRQLRRAPGWMVLQVLR